ncbi:uncharacterized protein LOC108471578 [Gossypium arboreum]|uniref:uncharacterized protein LOC108471578 n=1 Tax=Gossypium arboreum TaxID=29729 RepID=UPI00081975E9|nr:uncharacterized protein LOC108471578 [Gossypium arboreum]
MRKDLEGWTKQISRSRKFKNEVLTSKLSTLLEADRNDENLADIIDTKILLNFEIEKDECYWEQRARINWLKLGDRNTAFFHKQATQRKMRNPIQKMQFEDDKITEKDKDMGEIARDYFQKLFSIVAQGNLDQILSGID